MDKLTTADVSVKMLEMKPIDMRIVSIITSIDPCYARIYLIKKFEIKHIMSLNFFSHKNFRDIW